MRDIAFTLITFLIIGFAFVAIISTEYMIVCDGERETSKYTGKLQYIDVENDLCCHCHTQIKLYNQSIIHTYNCDESLEDIPINNTYTFYLDAHPEPYATTRKFGEPSCFWAQVVRHVEDEDGNTIWSSGWF